MNRYLTQFPLTFEKKVVKVFGRVTFGASGAPTLDAKNSKGIVSIARNGAGDYTVVFGTKAGMLDTYVKTLVAKHVFNTSGAGGAAPAAPALYIKQSQVSVPGQCSVRIVFNAAGTATDPASGEVVHLEFVFGDSTAP